MGKHEALTPKAIANKIKAKGLQKLKWYCQLCQKQCRDENGFKCHIESESHQRQMEVFSDRSSFIVNQYSQEFEEDFLRLLSRQYLNSKVSANQVYADYIKDRHHIHMNSTQWTTLTEFVKYLGKTSKCIVEETPKGWYISYINRDPAYITKRQNEEKKERMEIVEEERQKQDIEKRLKELHKYSDSNLDQEKIKPSELTEQDKEQLANIGLTLKSNTSKLSYDKNIFNNNNNNNNNSSNIDNNKSSNSEVNPKPYSKKLSAIEEIMLKEKERQQQKQQQPPPQPPSQQQQQNNTTNTSPKEVPWIIKDIVVKIIDKELAGGKYYKKKGHILSVENEFLARVKLLDSSDVLKIDQIFLETVIPQVGSEVVVLNGRYRGKIGVLQDVNYDKFNATLKLSENPTVTLPYEDFSKLY